MAEDSDFTLTALFGALVDQLPDARAVVAGSDAYRILSAELPENSGGDSTISGLELAESAGLPAAEVTLLDARGLPLAPSKYYQPSQRPTDLRGPPRLLHTIASL